MTERLNKRQHAKALTRQKVLDAARKLWATPGSYERGTIRAIAKEAGMSTGAVFANFDGKAALYAAAFDTDHAAGDSVLSRAAPELFQALQDLVDIRPEVSKGDDAFAAQSWRIAEALLERVKDQLLEEQAKAEAKNEAAQPPACHAIVELVAA